MTTFYCLRLETPQPGGPGPRIYILQEEGGPVIPPDTGFPFRRLLRLAGLRWRYLTPPLLSRYGSWSALYNLRTDCNKNTASQNSSFACVSVEAITWRLLSHCLATFLFAELFPSNSCPFWLQFWLSADMPQYQLFIKFVNVMVARLVTLKDPWQNSN
jgi:hypothetical protein